MLPIFKYPFSSFNQVNLDWIMKTLGQVKTAIPLVENATDVYEQALSTLSTANTTLVNVTAKADAAASSATAAQTAATNAQASATAAATSAGTAAQQAAYAATDASAANQNAQTANTNASTALSTANAAASAAAAASAGVTWTYLQQLEVEDAENHRDVQSSLFEVTTSKGGLLIEINDPYSNYGSGTVEIPAPAMRGLVPNYLSTSDNSRFFYWSPLGSATARKLGIRITVTTETVGSGADAVTHYYARVRITGTSTTLSTDPCYINIYGR